MAVCIRVNCPTCGDLEVESPALVLFVYKQAPQRNYYRFSCPSCTESVERSASETVCRSLSGVVHHEYVTIPEEALEPRAFEHPLTMDEVLDLLLIIRHL